MVKLVSAEEHERLYQEKLKRLESQAKKETNDSKHKSTNHNAQNLQQTSR